MKRFTIILLVSLLFIANSTFSQPPTRAEAKLAAVCYNNNFYNQYGPYGPTFKSYYWTSTAKQSRLSIWQQAEAIEMLIDAYEINPDADFLKKIEYLYNGMRDSEGVLWTSNKFNDDIMWGVLTCTRAYFLKNDAGMRNMAVNNFDMCWNRSWDNALGGGLWWTTERTGKNVAVNGVGALAAIYLYKATGQSHYLDKGKMIMNWVRSKLFVAGTGEVKGSMNSGGVIDQGSLTYTQGTFIGACGELHKYFPNEGWLDAGKKAMDYAKNRISDSNGVFPDENGCNDCPGFKGILARWACKFVADYGLSSTYGQWLNYNAYRAWKNRNSKGLMWARWNQRCTEGTVGSWEATSGVAMMNNIYRYNAAQGREVQPGVVLPVANEKVNLFVSHDPSRQHVTANLQHYSGNATMAVIDLSGKIIETSALQKGNGMVDTKNFKSGLYIIKIGTPTQSFTKKLFINN
jgi:predicted alpha-1,6-mannanase (GH76 family)